MAVASLEKYSASAKLSCNVSTWTQQSDWAENIFQWNKTATYSTDSIPNHTQMVGLRPTRLVPGIYRLLCSIWQLWPVLLYVLLLVRWPDRSRILQIYERVTYIYMFWSWPILAALDRRIGRGRALRAGAPLPLQKQQQEPTLRLQCSSTVQASFALHHIHIEAGVWFTLFLAHARLFTVNNFRTVMKSVTSYVHVTDTGPLFHKERWALEQQEQEHGLHGFFPKALAQPL